MKNQAKKVEVISRRTLLKGAGIASLGIGAFFVLPDKWTKPLVKVGVLPAHAQTSGCACTATFRIELQGDTSDFGSQTSLLDGEIIKVGGSAFKEANRWELYFDNNNGCLPATVAVTCTQTTSTVGTTSHMNTWIANTTADSTQQLNFSSSGGDSVGNGGTVPGSYSNTAPQLFGDFETDILIGTFKLEAACVETMTITIRSFEQE